MTARATIPAPGNVVSFDAAVRSPPVNPEAEKCLLGAIFVDNRAYERVSGFLAPEHFAVPQHGLVYEAIAKLIASGSVADPVALKRMFEADGALADIGGTGYLAELAGSAVTIINAGEYGRIVHDLFVKRELIALGEEMIEAAHAGPLGETAADQIERHQTALTVLSEADDGRQGTKGLVPIATAAGDAVKAIDDAYKRDGALAGLPTGIHDLDRLLGGIGDGDLVIVAGATSMGKSALAANIAEHCATLNRDSGGADGAAVGYFSLEMSGAQLSMRLFARRTGIEVRRQRVGDLEAHQFQDINAARADVATLPLHVDESSGLPMAAITQRARRMMTKHGLGLIIVDYLQLIAPDSRYAGNRVAEVGEISRGLKGMAKELGVPVIALSQLSRQVDQREDKRPRKSDLRESGTLEHDADTIILLFREDYYLAEGKPYQRADESEDRYMERVVRWEAASARAAGTAEIIVPKSRHGPTGVVRTHFSAVRQVFGDLHEERRQGEVL